MGKTFVLIDDDQADLHIMGSVLSRMDADIRCISFKYPVEAIKQLCNEDFVLPDYIFIDLIMPRMSGSECLLELRKFVKFEGVPIIMFSTCMSGQDSDSLRKGGATFTFKKPYNMNGYIEILNGLTLIDSIN